MRKRANLIGLFVPFNNRTFGEPKILKEGRVEAFSNTWFYRYGFGGSGNSGVVMRGQFRAVQVLVG